MDVQVAAAPTAKQQWLEQNLKEGEVYAGLILGEKGEPDYHLVLRPGDVADVSWEGAKEFAAKAGGALPTRREQSLLFANTKGEFQQRAYWSAEQHGASAVSAWAQLFGSGTQGFSGKSASCRARAVRRLPI